MTASEALNKVKKRKLNVKFFFVVLSFILPALAFYLIFMLMPIVDTLKISLTDWNGIKLSYNYEGLKNYWNLITDKLFISAVLHTLFWVAAQLVIIVIPTLILAYAITHVKRGMAFFRAAYYLPAIVSFPVAAVIWGKIYNPTMGPINAVLKAVGLGSLAQNWLGNQYTVLPALIIASTWVQYGFYLVIFMAGLQGIDKQLYESADIDGASTFVKLFRITVPSLSNTVNLIVSLVIINAFKGFSMVWINTQGGPMYKSDLIATYIYREAFTSYKVGLGSAGGILLAVFIMAATVLFNVVREKRDAT